MINPFSASSVTGPAADGCYDIDLDPREPFLDDHRPGGSELFGTVMQLEAAAEAIHRHTGGGIGSLRNIRVGPPYILEDEAAGHRVTVRVRRIGAMEHYDFHCTLSSRSIGGADVIHSEAVVRTDLAEPGGEPRFGVPQGGVPPGDAPQEVADRPVVSGEAIYECFFHGPSFRVVASAQWQGESMLCRLALPLPSLHRAGDHSLVSPRLVEFGLQTAGLLELASSGRMMIPDTIDVVKLIATADVGAASRLYARATLFAAANCANIEIQDVRGRAVMIIEGYRTVPLPFPADEAATGKLAGALRKTLGPY